MLMVGMLMLVGGVYFTLSLRVRGRIQGYIRSYQLKTNECLCYFLRIV